MSVYFQNRSLSNAHLEVDQMNSHALISYRSIVAGFLVTLFTMAGLTGLGLAVGGINMDMDTSIRAVGIFTGLWFVSASVVSLFAGSYFAARVSKFRTSRIGSAQGLVIAALFLGLILWQTFAMIGAAGNAVGTIIGSTGKALAISVQSASANPTITNTVSGITETAVGDLNLKSDLTSVAQGLSTRLLRGDTEGAKNYLAYQSGISRAEANQRITAMKIKINKAVMDAKEATGAALRSTGWTLFSLVVLGALAAVGGGAFGSMVNFRRPLIVEEAQLSPRHA